MNSAHEQRNRVTDRAILSNYLPGHVVEQLLIANQPASADLAPVIERLQALLHTIVSFVPEYTDFLHSTPIAGQPGQLHNTTGTLLAADLSGFTAFSAQLSTLGSEGAEIVAHTINTLFSMLIGTLAEWDGRLLKLSGDALTALFIGSGHAHRAATTALELQRRMGEFAALETPVGVFTLRIRIGLASGSVQLAQVGSAQRLELLVAGEPAREVVDHQRHASPGAVVLGNATADELQALKPEFSALGPGHFCLETLAPAAPSPPPAPFTWATRADAAWELHALINHIEALRPYLLDQHLARLSDGPPTLASQGELRPVTMLFANLSNVGQLLASGSSATDEAMASIQARIEQIWQIVEQYGGTVNKLDLHSDGHTLIALFGAPIAQSRDAEQAVGCALALMHTLGTGGPLQLRRIGVASGRVFAGAVGSPARREYTVMGAAVNLAARLMDAAENGQILLDAATARAAEHRFKLQAQPPIRAKGYTHLVPCFTPELDEGPRLNLLTRAHGQLVGRAADLARARAAVDHALGGAGGSIALVGEAGIGKSRLLAELVHNALLNAQSSVGLVVAHAQPTHLARPYYLLVELLSQLYDLPTQPDAAARLLALHALRALPDQQRFFPLLPTLFGLPGTESPITQALTPDERRARLQSLCVGLMQHRASDGPTALVVEDLHWADAASVAILSALASSKAPLPLVLLCTFRPEGAPAWPAATRIELAPLPPEQAQNLITARLGRRPLSAALRDAVIERTQGNPFFIEETIRALGEQAAEADAPPLPSNIQNALIARFDRLPLAERYMLQMAAVIGPQFDRPVLDGIAGAQDALGGALARLAERGIVRALGDGQYRFAHSLNQETIYESMLFAQRREIHRRVAAFVRTQQPARATAEPGLLAFHYRNAESWPEALEFAWIAGQRAQELYASDVALTHYQHALEAAERSASAIARRQRALILRRIGDLHALAGRLAEAAQTYASALAASQEQREQAEILIAWTEVCEGQAAYDDALAHLEQAEAHLGPADSALSLRICVRRGWVLVRSGDNAAAQEAVAPCLVPLEELECWGDLLLAYKVFFHIAMSQSRWREARSYLRLAIMNAERTSDLRELGRLRNNMGIVLTQEGNLRAAARECERAAAILHDIGDQHTLASVEVNIGAIHYKLGNYPEALNHYNASLSSATAIGSLPLEGIICSNLGELYRELGRLPESLAQIERSIELCGTIHDDLGMSEAQRQLAETFITMERLVEAEQASIRALDFAFAANDAQAEAIAYRVRGMLAGARSDYDLAIAEVQRSIQILTEIESTPELGQSLVVQARLWIGAGQPELAGATLDEAIALFQKAGASADLDTTSKLLAQLRAEEYESKVYL